MSMTDTHPVDDYGHAFSQPVLDQNKACIVDDSGFETEPPCGGDKILTGRAAHGAHAAGRVQLRLANVHSVKPRHNLERCRPAARLALPIALCVKHQAGD